MDSSVGSQTSKEQNASKWYNPISFDDKQRGINRNVKRTNRPKLLAKHGRDDIYTMTARIRGHCLICCNSKFKFLPALTGYNFDIDILKRVFTQLGFKVKTILNWTIDQLKTTSSKYAKSVVKKELGIPDALIVIVLTHGTSDKLFGRCFKNFVETPEEFIDVSDFRNLFNNQNCPLLQGKPKVFYIQACRGGQFDEGVPRNINPTLQEVSDDEESIQDFSPNSPAMEGHDLTAVAANEATPLTDDEFSESVIEPEKLPTVSDMATYYATCSGFASFVYNTGSVFVVCLAWNLIHHAHHMDFNELYQKVARDLLAENIRGVGGRILKQSVDLSHQSFSKKLFFNPGYPKEGPPRAMRKRKPATANADSFDPKLNKIPSVILAVNPDSVVVNELNKLQILTRSKSINSGHENTESKSKSGPRKRKIKNESQEKATPSRKQKKISDYFSPSPKQDTNRVELSSSAEQLEVSPSGRPVKRFDLNQSMKTSPAKLPR